MSQIIRYEAASAAADIETLTADTGGPVGPDGAGNINILGGDGIDTVGNPGTNTITVSQSADAYTIATGQTVGAVTDDIFTFTVGEDEAITIQATITGAVSDYSAALMGRVLGGARRVAAGATTLIPSSIADFGEDSAGSPSIDIVVSGNDVIVQVTGVAAETWNWRAQIHYVHITV